MKEDVKQTVEAISNHPKVSLGLTAAFTSNAWLDYGLPIVQGLTSLLGLGVLFLIFFKHAVDVVRIIRKWWEDED